MGTPATLSGSVKDASECESLGTRGIGCFCSQFDFTSWEDNGAGIITRNNPSHFSLSKVAS